MSIGNDGNDGDNDDNGDVVVVVVVVVDNDNDDVTGNAAGRKIKRGRDLPRKLMMIVFFIPRINSSNQ